MQILYCGAFGLRYTSIHIDAIPHKNRNKTHDKDPAKTAPVWDAHALPCGIACIPKTQTDKKPTIEKNHELNH